MIAVFRKISWTVPVSLLLAFAAPGAQASLLTVREVHAQSASIDSLSKAVQLLNGSITAARTSTSQTLVVNYVDPQSASRGRFGVDVPLSADAAFPGGLAGDDNNFALQIDGNVVIPSAGAWTFGVNADNGVRVRVGSNVMSRSGFSSATLLNTFTFPAAGTYPLAVTYYEHTGQSGLELFAAPGTLASGSDAAFRLVGDVANGGLTIAPEPTGVLPLALLAALMIRHRRRAA